VTRATPAVVPGAFQAVERAPAAVAASGLPSMPHRQYKKIFLV
jgi:hypothetical protein